MKPGYKYRGGYTAEELIAVQGYDKKLLSDLERRESQAGMLASAYVTVTAEGGFGSRRRPLDKAAKVLYIESTGPHFENTGSKPFQPVEGGEQTISSAAQDFIIAPSAPENSAPAFPHLYPDGKIPSFDTAKPNAVCTLNDGNIDAEFVTLPDNSLFNRKAFETATQRYFTNLVIPALKHHIGSKPCYLKAVFIWRWLFF